MQTLSPTPRSTPTRSRHRAVDDRTTLIEFLSEAPLAHLGAVVTRDGLTHPVVLPIVFAIDTDGPDAGGTLYLHGSSGAGWLTSALDAPACVTVTELDGLVLASSGFDHSVNYRSAVVHGSLRLVEDESERARALDLIVDHLIPGRAAQLRPATRKELAATVVLALPLHEASMKQRTGGPGEDADADVWTGHIPLRRVAGEPVPA